MAAPRYGGDHLMWIEVESAGQVQSEHNQKRPCGERGTSLEAKGWVWILWGRASGGQPSPWAVDRVVGGICQPYPLTGTEVCWESGLLSVLFRVLVLNIEPISISWAGSVRTDVTSHSTFTWFQGSDLSLVCMALYLLFSFQARL